MEFLSFREIRFADPVTAIKLSVSHLFYGTAMGRLVFYSCKDKTETVPLEYLQELIRGISHSKDGEKLYISVGDIGKGSNFTLRGDNLRYEKPQPRVNNPVGR